MKLVFPQAMNPRRFAFGDYRGFFAVEKPVPSCSA
jgi:hypothetical protein